MNTDPYTHPSMVIYDMLKAELMAKISEREDLVQANPDNELLVELRDALIENLGWLETMRTRGYFASVEKCAGSDHWIDWPRAYTDLALKQFKDSVQVTSLMPRADTDRLRLAIREEARKLENFAIANLRKAGIQKDCRAAYKTYLKTMYRNDLEAQRKQLEEMETDDDNT